MSDHILNFEGLGMGSLTPEIRECIVKAYRQGYKVKEITGIFGVSRYTVWYWVKRTYHPGRKNFRDRSRKPHTIHRKITPNIEDAIIVLRDSFNWGTQRIRVALLSPPPYVRYLLETVLGKTWREINISRQGINNILKKHGRNGSPYRKSKHEWKYFRASCPNDMWQIDIKGPFLLDGERINAFLILDDYSRFLVSVHLFKSITTDVVVQELNQCIEMYNEPNKILSDNGPQFREQFTEWCNQSGRDIEVVHSPPYYPQAKGKVERCIRNFNEEYIRLDKVFEDTSTLLEEYKEWYNNKRYHLGINDCPVNVYST